VVFDHKKLFVLLKNHVKSLQKYFWGSKSKKIATGKISKKKSISAE
jgi:hypothetical protein